MSRIDSVSREPQSLTEVVGAIDLLIWLVWFGVVVVLAIVAAVVLLVVAMVALIAAPELLLLAAALVLIGGSIAVGFVIGGQIGALVATGAWVLLIALGGRSGGDGWSLDSWRPGGSWWKGGP